MAAVMHLASIPAPFVSPMVGLILFKNSRYVCAHSFQALYEAAALKALLVIATICSLAYTLTQLWHHYQTDWQDWNWTTFLLRIAIGWILVTILGFITTIQAVVAAGKAHSGSWPRQGRVQNALLKRFDA